MAFDHELMGRVGGLALIDIVGTVAIAYMLHPSYKSIVLALIVGELVHLALGIRTPIVDKL
jgi:hypothetical protein